MMLKYFLTMWLEKISGLALVLVKTFQMSVGPDDEIVVGQIPLEQQGCKGERTWLSSWALDEVTLSSEAFGLVTAKYCGTQITFQFCYILSLSLFFFFNVTGIILWKSSGFMSCRKEHMYSLHFCHFSCSFWRHQSLGFECFALGFFRKNNISKKTYLCEVQDILLSFFITWWDMLNRIV